MNLIKSKRAAGAYALAVAIFVLIIGILVVIAYLTNNPSAKQTTIEIVGAATKGITS